jgi:hypothetical protein
VCTRQAERGDGRSGWALLDDYVGWHVLIVETHHR